jgi:drug/metabolite transporter (DMT)-like permease|tara:strand:+ start:5048 stop:5950 length:903 start_codon:yes stop_codon:yes gene_type:complete
MRKASFFDFSILLLLAAIWGSAFFNIKIASSSYTPITLALGRVLFAGIPLLTYCYFKKIKISFLGSEWKLLAGIALVNLVLPFFFISYGIIKVQSNLAAILMSVAPIAATIFGHFFTKNEKNTLMNSAGILVGFLGIVYLFSDNILINETNIFSALIIILGPICYTLGGLVTLRLENKKNEDVTTSILIWAIIFLIPLSFIIEKPWNLDLEMIPTLSLIYLGVVPTAGAWLLRFYILRKNGLVFQSQVAYLIPIFGLFFGFIFLDEIITHKVIISLGAVLVGIFLVERSKYSKKQSLKSD